MKVLVYVNPEKEIASKTVKKLAKTLEKNLIEYKIVYSETEIDLNEKFEVLFVIGGDGTILRRTKFASKSNLPIIGINCGKLGYLSEFEIDEIDLAVDMLLKNQLIEDARINLSISYKGKEYLALNDVNIQRTYLDNKGNVINVSFSIDGNKVETIVGDGIIVATPTGSTAYSLSAGGPILVPGINSLSITPVSAHSLGQRSVVFSAESKCDLVLEGSNSAGLFVDGKFICDLKEKDVISVKKASNKTVFLRREQLNFYKKLSKKLFSRTINNYD
ncbi:MAG: NAD(+)/NADH kinase [Clostridia bacterium]|nr:NAD(+)/NADH kinase [Clostridia bacterium]